MNGKSNKKPIITIKRKSNSSPMDSYKITQKGKTTLNYRECTCEQTYILTEKQIRFFDGASFGESMDEFESSVLRLCEMFEQGLRAEQVPCELYKNIFSRVLAYSTDDRRITDSAGISDELMSGVLFILHQIVFSDQGWHKFLDSGYIDFILIVLKQYTEEVATETIWIEEKILVVILELAKNKYQVLEVPKVDNGNGEKVFDENILKQFQDLFRYCYILYDKFARLISISSTKKITPEQKSILELSYENRIVALEICVYLFTHYSDQCPSNKIQPGIRINASLSSILSEAVNENAYKEFSAKSREKAIHIIYLLFKGMKYHKNFYFFLTPELIDLQILNLYHQTNEQNIIMCLQTLAITCSVVNICACYVINSKLFNEFNPFDMWKSENVILAYCQVWKEASYITTEQEMFFSFIQKQATEIIKNNATKIIDMSFELFERCNFDIIKEIFLLFVSYINIGDNFITQYILKKFNSSGLNFIQSFVYHFQSSQSSNLPIFIEACKNLILFSQIESDFHNILEYMIEEGIGNIFNFDLNTESFTKKYQNIIEFIQKCISEIQK